MVWFYSRFYSWPFFFRVEHFSRPPEVFHHGFTLLQSPSAVHHSRFTSATELRDYCVHAWWCTTSHYTTKVSALLRVHFGNERVIFRRFPTAWPPHSPGLNPCDFCLWGFLKDHVCRGNIQTVLELKVSITRHVSSIDRETLRDVCEVCQMKYVKYVNK